VPGEGVIACYRQDTRLAAHDWSNNEVGLVDRETCDHQVDFATPEWRMPLTVWKLHDLHFGLTVLGLEDLDHLEQFRANRTGIRDPYPHHAGDGLAGPGKASEHIEQLGVGRFQLAAEAAPGRGKADAATRAIHEPITKTRLKRT